MVLANVSLFPKGSVKVAIAASDADLAPANGLPVS
jgi:hypothetical protein